MTKETQTDKKQLRAEKRAAALRDNLRRRKAASQTSKENNTKQPTPNEEKS